MAWRPSRAGRPIPTRFAGFVPAPKGNRDSASRLQGVAPIRSMRFAARESRREHADEAQIALKRSQDVRVVPVERVDGSGPDRKGASGRDLDDLPLPGDAIVRLEVVLVMEVLLGPLGDDGVVNRAAPPARAK